MVSARIKDFNSTSITTIIKKMDETSKKVYEFHEKVPDDSGFIRYIYHFMMTLTDSSV